MRPELRSHRLAAVVNTLHSCQLFSGIPPEDLEGIAAFVIPKALEKGEYLFHEGDPAEGFYVVRTGAINVHRVSAAGKEQVISVFRPGQSFAEAAVATRGGYPAEARAIEPSTLLLVPKAGFLDLLRNRPELALRMLASMSQHLRVLVSRLEDLTLKDVETRLAHWLLKRCPRPPGTAPATVRLEETKRVLAAELGTTGETLSRTLAQFRDDALIAVTGKTITVHCPEELEKRLRRNLGER